MSNSIYRTGQIWPESGVYRLTGHECASRAQREIPLSKRERFPPCRGCDGAAS